MSENPAVLSYSIVVGPEAIDEYQHVNNTVYVKWMQELAVAHTTALGCSMGYYEELGSGWVASSHHIKYLRPCYEGDVLEASTWISTIEGSHSRRRYTFKRQGKLVAFAETIWAYVSFTSKRPCPIPECVSGHFLIPEPEPFFPKL